MYDTVGMRLGAEVAPQVDVLDHVPPLLTNTSVTYFDEGRAVSVGGQLNNMKVRVNRLGIKVTGSLAKYQLGDNWQALTRGATQRAIEQLSDELGLPMQAATVSRLDIGHNFIVRHPEHLYRDQLGAKRYFKRLEQNNGLYYMTGREQLAFYGKVKEQRMRRQPIPNLYNGRHVLRYEQRYTKQLCKTFNRAEITGATLTDEVFYMDLIERWKQAYFDIGRKRHLTFDTSVMNSLKDFEMQLLILGIEAAGGEAEVMKRIEEGKHTGIFANRMQPARLKDKIKRICSTPQLTRISDEIGELDRKVNEAARFYR